MNRRIVATAVAAIVVGAALIVVVPQHAGSVVRVLTATVAVVAGGLVVLSVAPVVARTPPESRLDHAPSRVVLPLDPHGLRDARRDLDRPVAAGRTVPEPVWERIVVATMLRMQRLGIDVASPRTRDQAQTMLAPDTWRLVTTQPSPGSYAGRAAARDSVGVARTVHRALDDLDSLTQRPGGANGHR